LLRRKRRDFRPVIPPALLILNVAPSLQRCSADFRHDVIRGFARRGLCRLRCRRSAGRSLAAML